MKTALWQVLPAFQIYRSLALTDRNNERVSSSPFLPPLSFDPTRRDRERERKREGEEETAEKIASDLGQNDLAVVVVVVSLFATAEIR